MKKRLFAILAIMIIATLTLGVGLLSGCTPIKPAGEVQEFTYDSLKVGIVSDTQLPPETNSEIAKNTYIRNLRNALNVLKYKGVNMIIFAGDLGDLGTEFAYDTLNKTINEVYGDKKPLFQFIMGNHDYWGRSAKSQTYYRELFQSKLNQNPWTHYKVNGYHFIGASPSSGSMSNGYDGVTSWLEKQIKIAQAEDPTKPIFVTTHNAPKDTSYGSDDWGDKGLDKVFKKYPTVVNFSGHVHYSLLDERSIWQEDYTVINTQSLSYTELEKGKENGTIPPNSDATPMGYIMDFVTPERIEISRYDFSNGGIGNEQKSGRRWEIPTNLTKEKFKYTKALKLQANTAPVFNDVKGSYKVVDGGIEVTFKAANDDDFVHNYKVVLNDKKKLYYFSDFYNGIYTMAGTVKITIKCNPNDINKINIYALDSYNKQSAQCVILNVTR